MANKCYVTTPIYYVNASPHIGHSYTTIAADTLVRFRRKMLGKENVWFLTGTDEHGHKIQKSADEQKISAQEFVDRTVRQFRELWGKLGISYDDFIRTTEKRHIDFVQQVLAILEKKGEFYSANYQGWYCTPCETFWTESQLVEQSCPDCKRPVEKISETNYFFKLSKYRRWLIDYIKSNPYFILPEIRRNEVLSFLELNELSDLCISRPRERLSWGIPLPFSPDHVTYVWFDALVNYISAVGSFDDQGVYRSPWWQKDAEVIHLIGKDILRQHAVYWPAMLHALGIELPKKMTIFAHGWWLLAETKMSKSLGNVVSPLEMVDKFGIDVYRYFLLRDVPFGLDGNFSQEAIVKRFNFDLANDLGNLLYRTLTMVEKYYQGTVPQAEAHSEERAREIQEAISGLGQQIGLALDPAADFNFSQALEKIWALIAKANKYIEDKKPWNLAKENKNEELKAFIRLLAETIREIARQLYPFMPGTAEAITRQIGGDSVAKGAPLFPRIDTKAN
jgi:methionyl-tRNA synthetase